MFARLFLLEKLIKTEGLISFVFFSTVLQHLAVPVRFHHLRFHNVPNRLGDVARHIRHYLRVVFDSRLSETGCELGQKHASTDVQDCTFYRVPVRILQFLDFILYNCDGTIFISQER